MGMNLHDIIVNPGRSRPFQAVLNTERLDFPAVTAYVRPPEAEGTIRNEGGALSLRGRIRADMLCVCDRCMTEFTGHREIPLDIPLATELQDEDNPDYYLLQGDELDLDDLLESCFILDMDSRLLCREDCRGLCSRCGANLNLGPCACKKEKDPRLAVLEQLLDDKENNN